MPRLQLVTPPSPRESAPLPGPDQLWLFECSADGGVDLAALRKERAALAVSQRARNTAKAYAFDWADFSGWCKRAGRSALPATSDTLQLYMVGLAKSSRALATIARRAAAVAAQHAAEGHRSPIDADVREVLEGLRRRLGSAPTHRKAALSPEDLFRMVDACPCSARGRRDRALLLLGFASSLRRSELAALQLADVDQVSQGLVVRLGRGKTDQAGVGREIGVHRGAHGYSCPPRAVANWLCARGDWPGPLFCYVDRKTDAIAKRPMSGESIAVAIKEACRRVGLDPAKYSGHSLRAGCATACSANHADALAIMQRTGHKSVEMVGRYVRHGSLFAVDPLAGVL
jgi:integrase